MKKNSHLEIKKALRQTKSTRPYDFEIAFKVSTYLRRDVPGVLFFKRCQKLRTVTQNT